MSSLSNQIPLAPPHAGAYKAIVVDPPWDQGKTGKRAARPRQGTVLDYATLPLRDIYTVAPVDEWANTDAFIWLWAGLEAVRDDGD